MSTVHTWNPKVGLLTGLAIILAIIVAFQGVALYRIAGRHFSWPSAMSLTIPSWKPHTPNPDQIGGANVAVNRLPDPGNAALSANNDLWSQVQQFHNQMDQLFANTFAQPGFVGLTGNNSGFTVPSMDLRDAKDHYVVQMDMPGANKSTIKINVEGRFLSVSGQRETSNETKDSSNQVVRSERSMAEFERTMTLPGPVNAATVTANYANGVLTINLPKTDKAVDATHVTVH